MDYLKLCTENIYVLIGLLILLAAFLFQVVLYLSYYRVVMRRGRKERKGKIAFSVERPAVSVIICARNEEENLEQLLPLFLEPDYPDYEVIVVNDGSWVGSDEVLRHSKSLFEHL